MNRLVYESMGYANAGTASFSSGAGRCSDIACGNGKKYFFFITLYRRFVFKKLFLIVLNL